MISGSTSLTATDDKTPPGRPFAGSLLAIVVAWIAGVLASWILSSSGLLGVDQGVLRAAAIGSGLVATASALPGLLSELYPFQETRRGATSSGVTLGFSAGVLIRLAGTVALVGLCSYHLPAAKKEIAGTILAWYVYLTTIDITVLAMLLSRLDRRKTATRS